jgi:cell division protease FtsH
VDRPTSRGREKILRVHAKQALCQDGGLCRIAKLTPGFTGADLANLMNESALLAARRHKEKIGQDEVEEAMERVIAGPERKSRVITEKERAPSRSTRAATRWWATCSRTPTRCTRSRL